MSGTLRATLVAVLLGVATLGEGGASAGSLVAQHVLLALTVVLSVFVLGPAPWLPARAPVRAWLVFAVLAAAGAVTAPYAYAAWLVIIEIAAFGAVVWLAAGDPVAWETIVPRAIAVYGGAHGVFAIAQKLGGAVRPASTFLNPNHLAAWLSAGVLLIAGSLTGREAAARRRGLLFAGSGLSLSGLVVIGSRGAAVGLAAGALALIALVWGKLSPRGRRGLVLATGVLGLAAVLGVAVRFRSFEDPYRFHRTRIWAASVKVLAAAPWGGTGPGQFAAAAANLNFPNEETPLRFDRSFRTPHSDVLRSACEFGIPAGIAALTAALLVAGALWRRRSGLTPVEAGAAAALVALAVQGGVDDLSTRPALTFFAAALIGRLVAVPRERPPSSVVRASARVVAVLLLAALGLGEIAGYLAWRSVHLLPRGPLDAPRLARLARALAWNPMHPDLWERRAEHEAGDGSGWDLAGYARAREAAERACRLQPADAIYARGAARIEAAACLSITPYEASRARAASLYERAQSLARTDATIALEEARFLLRAGDPARARRAAEAALRLEPRASAPRLWLAEAIVAGEGKAGAVEARRLLDEAIALAPPEGAIPASPYEASLRRLDADVVAGLRRMLDGWGSP